MRRIFKDLTGFRHVRSLNPIKSLKIPHILIQKKHTFVSVETCAYRSVRGGSWGNNNNNNRVSNRNNNNANNRNNNYGFRLVVSLQYSISTEKQVFVLPESEGLNVNPLEREV